MFKELLFLPTALVGRSVGTFCRICQRTTWCRCTPCAGFSTSGERHGRGSSFSFHLGNVQLDRRAPVPRMKPVHASISSDRTRHRHTNGQHKDNKSLLEYQYTNPHTQGKSCSPKRSRQRSASVCKSAAPRRKFTRKENRTQVQGREKHGAARPREGRET